MAEQGPWLALIDAESVRKLDRQTKVVEALRGRSGLLLSAGSLSLAPRSAFRGIVCEARVLQPGSSPVDES